MKKRIVLFLIFFITIFLVTGCSTEKRESVDYQSVTLKINMPLNFDDLDDDFEYSMTQYLAEKEMGEIVGDGSSMDDYGPYATDIEFDIRVDKMEDFQTMLLNYRFPQGSYFISDDYTSELFGDLTGVRLVFQNLSTDQIENLYSELSKFLENSYIYKTIYQVDDKITVYYYDEDIQELKNKINQYMESKNLKNDILVMDMPTIIEEN